MRFSKKIFLFVCNKNFSHAVNLAVSTIEKKSVNRINCASNQSFSCRKYWKFRFAWLADSFSCPSLYGSNESWSSHPYVLLFTYVVLPIKKESTFTRGLLKRGRSCIYALKLNKLVKVGALHLQKRVL